MNARRPLVCSFRSGHIGLRCGTHTGLATILDSSDVCTTLIMTMNAVMAIEV